MNIADFCSRHVVTIEPGAELRGAATLMRKAHVGALVVTERGESGERPRGIVTDRGLAAEMSSLAAALKRGTENEELEQRLDIILRRMPSQEPAA